MVDQPVIESVENYLHEVVQPGILVTCGVLFGSWVAGQADQWSDIDLLVVSPRFDKQPTWEDAWLMWRLAARIDHRIEPIPVGARMFAEDDSSAIIEIARRVGQIIPLAG